MPRDGYLRFLPLDRPRLVAGTEASRRFQLFGDRDDPGYRDVDPPDGIDDRRGHRLHRIAVRFSPNLVRNTFSLPLDGRRLYEEGIAPLLQVDRWRLDRPGGELVATRSVNLAEYGPEDAGELLRLLRAFDPRNGGVQADRPTVVGSRGEHRQVLFIDMPGDGPRTWKQIYRSPISREMPRSFRSLRKIYAHPFVHEVHRRADRSSRFEFVLQYWFFYPFNDGGNNHEGDWEHVNVVLIPAGSDRTGLTGAEVRRIVGSGAVDPLHPDSLRIGRVEYYFHHKVMTLDYLNPNVYASRQAWRRQVEERAEERIGERWLWHRIRERAYADREESRLNPHPVVYIGADNKGIDQLLAFPGGTNQDSHGSYPFPGLWKDIGPAAAAEQIGAGPNLHFDLAHPDRRPDPRLERFDDPSRVELLPDWERVLEPALEDPEMRRRWAWLVLPVRWGYPAVRSPFAGVVAHAETGNTSPLGPAYNSAWNRVGETLVYEAYEPHKFGGTFPLGWQDSFLNSWGFLNLTAPTLVNLPPFDLVWRLVLAPVRAPFQARHPTFYPRETVPTRFVSVGGGVSVAPLPDDFTLLFSVPELFEQLSPVLETPPEPEVRNRRVATGVAPLARVNFHIGERFVSQNSLRRVEADLGFDLVRPSTGELLPVRGRMQMWEYSGSLRYNLSTGNLQPFVKGGYGLSWYRLRDATLAGEPMDPDRSPWVRQPDITSPGTLLPNTWHAGAGVEALLIRNVGAFPEGLDMGIRVSYSVRVHGLGLDRPEQLTGQDDIALGRSYLDAALLVSF